MLSDRAGPRIAATMSIPVSTPMSIPVSIPVSIPAMSILATQPQVMDTRETHAFKRRLLALEVEEKEERVQQMALATTMKKIDTVESLGRLYESIAAMAGFNDETRALLCEAARNMLLPLAGCGVGDAVGDAAEDGSGDAGGDTTEEEYEVVESSSEEDEAEEREHMEEMAAEEEAETEAEVEAEEAEEEAEDETPTVGRKRRFNDDVPWKKLTWKDLDRLELPMEALVTVHHNKNWRFSETLGDKCFSTLVQRLANEGKRMANWRICGFIKVCEHVRLLFPGELVERRLVDLLSTYLV
eukprot:930176-Rhodomonas_salina.3